MSEILFLQWDWLDLPNGRVVWPDSKTAAERPERLDGDLALQYEAAYFPATCWIGRLQSITTLLNQ